MRRLAIIAAGLVILGAGCSNASPAPQNQGPTSKSDNGAAVAQNQPSNTNQTVNPNPEKPQILPPASTGTAKPTGSGDITLAEVQQANSPAKCWTIVNGNVYDVTNFAPKHPGGKEAVLKLCGMDGTSAFTQKHGGQEKPEAVLKGLMIGKLAK